MISQIQLVAAMSREIAKQGVNKLNARQMNSLIEAANIVCRELRDEHRPAGENTGIDKWLNSDETGMSSLFMARVLSAASGKPKARNAQVYDPFERTAPYPHDPSDFARCIGLLKAAPELRMYITELRNHGPIWKEFADHWEELESLFNEEFPSGKAPLLFARIQTIVDGVREKETT